MSYDCGGCREQLLYPNQHATMCPGFYHHAVVEIAADFIECRCGHLSVNKVDRQSHVDAMRRLSAQRGVIGSERTP
jgi:hypothetical protein